MATEKKLSDLDYCYASILLLEELEKTSYARNERIRLFHEKTHARQAVISGVVASILPVILWGYLLLSKVNLFDTKNMANFGTSLVGLLMMTALLFLVPYLLLNAVWHQSLFRGLKVACQKHLKTLLLADVKVIDDKAKYIVSKDVFVEPRIPEEYFSVDFLSLLVRYFESGQATFMKEALYSLKLELQNTGYYSSSSLHQTLLSKEKDYLADESKNLEMMIEKEGLAHD